MKLAKFEDSLNASLTSAYLRAALESCNCVKDQVRSVASAAKSSEKRVQAMQSAAVQQILGHSFGRFTASAMQSLQEWRLLSQSLGLKQDAQDFTTPEGLLQSLTSAQRSIASTKQSFGVSATDLHLGALQEHTVEDTRLALRYQKHQNEVRRNELLGSKQDAVALAEKLRLLRVADEEADAKLRKLQIDTPKVVVPQAQQPTHELDDLAKVITSLIDQAHILNVEAETVRQNIAKHVFEQTSADAKALHEGAEACVLRSKLQLDEVTATALKEHDARVSTTRQAEKTIALELDRVSKTLAERTAVEDCVAAIAESARWGRRTRDAATLEKHKSELHILALSLQTDIHTL
jgi:prolyl-tRNA editing enzyme YbaK/EbsC (Cys-tRNA(Pro) deacylase)